MNATNPQSNGSIIDFDQLQSASDGDAALLRDLMQMYFTQADEIMAGLQKAAQEGDVPGVDHFSHKLAGSSLACGMSVIVPPLRSLEMNAKAGHLNGAEGFLSEAAMGLELLRSAVEDYLAQLPNS